MPASNRRKIILGAALCLLASCASPPPATRSHFDISRARDTKLFEKMPATQPAWVAHPPQSLDFRYFVGEARGIDDKDDALEKAWVSAFVRIGLLEFPELASLSDESVENLKATTFRRRFALRLENVNWTGIREAKELGSPYLARDEKTGHFTAYRLLKWSEKDIELAHSRVQRSKVFRLPRPPESAQEEEDELVASVRKIQDLNEHLEHRNLVFDSVLSKVKCGVTIADLIHILGAPDRYNPMNATIIEKEYYWGTYRVERIGDNPAITAITREDGKHPRQIICRSSLPSRVVDND